MGVGRSFDELVVAAEAAPIEGWDFTWLDGRATEERPPWRYSERLAERYEAAERALDLQSGGGEVVAGAPALPPVMVVTEGYRPNVRVAARRLHPRGAHVVAADDRALPLRSDTFDLVTSRHPVETAWDEIARVLAPGGTYLSQQIGPHTVRELSEFFLGPLPPTSNRDPAVARRAAEAAGLDVVDLREARLRMEFFDVGAVVYFLRLVVWIVPDFRLARYREQLEALHDEIRRGGAFVAHATRFLIEARKPSLR